MGATYTYDSAAGAPKGDYFDNPIKISGESGTHVIDDNSDYTIEDGEPSHTEYLSGNTYYSMYECRSVWYEWTAPGSGTMTFTTSSSSTSSIYPTFIAVYTGDSLSSLERLTFSTTLDTNYATPISLSVEQGVTYRIVGMMGDNGAGTFTLTWSGNLTVQASAYDTWAAANGLGGAEEVTAGVANAFRYVFDIPSAEFSPISSIGLNSSGQVVLTLPEIVNTDGVTLKVLSTTDLSDWSSSSVSERSVTVGSNGTLTFDDADPARFYRLKAVLDE